MAITSTVMLKPAPHPAAPLAGEKVVPLTVFDRAAFDLFVPIVFAYHAPAPSNEALKEGFRTAVAAYPHMAGRLAADRRGRRVIDVSGEGVLVVEATVEADLADVLATHVATDLYPAAPEEEEEEGYFGAALMQVKLSRFRCGGLVVGFIVHHHVCDGHAMSAFCVTWARAVREGKAFDVPSPSLDRAITGVARSPPAPVFDHRSIEFKGGDHQSRSSDTSSGTAAAVDIPTDNIRNLAVHFTAEFVAELKARVGGRCSTFECLIAHVWKKITAARGLKPEEFTRVKVAVNCRRRASPPVPMDFFGNMVLWAFPRLQVRRLLSSSYGGVVGAIRAAVSRIDADYIQSFVDFGEVADAGGEELAATAAAPGERLCPDLEVDSWLGFRFHELDLGSRPPAAVLAPDLPVEGLMILVPSRTANGGGGVNLFVALAEDHAQAFEQICYSLEEHPAILSHL